MSVGDEPVEQLLRELFRLGVVGGVGEVLSRLRHVRLHEAPPEVRGHGELREAVDGPALVRRRGAGLQQLHEGLEAAGVDDAALREDRAVHEHGGALQGLAPRRSRSGAGADQRHQRGHEAGLHGELFVVAVLVEHRDQRPAGLLVAFRAARAEQPDERDDGTRGAHRAAVVGVERRELPQRAGRMGAVRGLPLAEGPDELRGPARRQDLQGPVRGLPHLGRRRPHELDERRHGAGADDDLGELGALQDQVPQGARGLLLDRRAV
eukprot:CAMPEP_0176298606 /NCGR_PEP_ID=MMETSP0121_2-20121125/59345_1 /TAXON_ID=160619 /ORGANISM="Kryptoperidinium foliaceum, Strain CCMP 1326" /LENGTH=264 /DNA_ID=CAMNT_0017639873 /DNA_START=80 /DNA_END=871 /DNA_ORIENTATION=-